MKIPKLEKKRNVTNLHGCEIIDDYSWVHQKDILEVLTDKKKLLPEVRDYLEKENDYTTFNLRDTKKTQDILFNEIKGRIKLDDESLKFIHVDDTYVTKSKLALINSIMLTIKSGLNILSINPMEEM